MHGLLGYCRQGFEPELAAELGERAARAGARVLRALTLVPFVLPTVVVFAFWPGLVGLRLVVP